MQGESESSDNWARSQRDDIKWQRAEYQERTSSDVEAECFQIIFPRTLIAIASRTVQSESEATFLNVARLEKDFWQMAYNATN